MVARPESRVPADSFSLTGKRIFVAGHNGLVGQAVCRRLAREDCESLTVPRDRLDLRDQAAVKRWFAIHRPDAVILAAARVGGIMANMTQPAAFLYDNLMIAANVIQASHEAGVVKLVNLGSSCIYPRDAAQPLAEDALLTGRLEDSNEAYAVAKIAAIKLCQSFQRQYGCRFISAMPCNLYGPGDRFDPLQSHVIPALMLKMAGAEGDVTLWGSGAPLREFLYVDDLAEALILLLRGYEGEDIVNIGSGSEISIAALAAKIAAVVGYRGEILFDATKPDGTPRKIMNSARMRGMGWSPATDLDTGLARMWEWYRKRDLHAA